MFIFSKIKTSVRERVTAKRVFRFINDEAFYLIAGISQSLAFSTLGGFEGNGRGTVMSYCGSCLIPALI